ncbi:enoyl-CoA hydratase/isomerase family protein [uncultured Cohaesibacter sp.]|uniref:enoyl-CoA hydratase/isomerase family protein n=1 Tax=uncultured Cohaesibacter sp. TaxID=1002546 RepID=UPI002AAB4647|nr:enoyl-CoA hydratase/isomerase family protein [uncultured Cohaesibacter sp.]
MDDMLFEKRGCVGLVTLNRAKALNALTINMINALSAQLKHWESDDTVKAVILMSASERAFSAGADIRFVYNSRANPPYDFFRVEYLMNCAMFRYPKPYISLVDGIVMGGGVGLSFHGRYIAAGSKTLFAMPETGIGFFPDVGGSYFLPRMPRHVGLYCGMTGARLGQADCLKFGLVTHAVEPDHFPAVLDAISNGAKPENCLAKYSEEAKGEGLEEEKLSVIENAFSGRSVSEIRANLKADPHPFAKETLDLMFSRSPMSVHVAFEQMRRGATLRFEDCMAMEYRILERILNDNDFYEGVRATIVDKDGAPRWNPVSFDDVSEEKVQAYFLPLDPDRELFNGS